MKGIKVDNSEEKLRVAVAEIMRRHFPNTLEEPFLNAMRFYLPELEGTVNFESGVTKLHLSMCFIAEERNKERGLKWI